MYPTKPNQTKEPFGNPQRNEKCDNKVKHLNTIHQQARGMTHIDKPKQEEHKKIEEWQKLLNVRGLFW